MIPFSSRSPAGAALVLLGVFALAGCYDRDRRADDVPTLHRFECAGAEGNAFRVAVRMGADTARVALSEAFSPRDRILTRSRSASGVRYEGDGTVVWSQGDDARITIDGTTFEGCRRVSRTSVRADSRRRGVVFRAIGQEPGWRLDVFSDHVEYVGEYGRRTLRLPRSSAPVDTTARRFVYRANTEDHELTAEVERSPCTDVMSGDAFRYTVTVTVDGETHGGCGRTLP